jgi:hypothetical protein
MTDIVQQESLSYLAIRQQYEKFYIDCNARLPTRHRREAILGYEVWPWCFGVLTHYAAIARARHILPFALSKSKPLVESMPQFPRFSEGPGRETYLSEADELRLLGWLR